MLASTEMELTFAACQKRQYHEISREGLRARGETVRPAGRFRYAGALWRPEAYPGHAVVTMVNAHSDNRALRDALTNAQQELHSGFKRPDALYFLPPSSFHQTIANTLSAENHHELVVARGLLREFPRMAGDALESAPVPPADTIVTMRMIGMGIFGAALGILGVFDRESEFDRIAALRDHFYGNDRIIGLGIRRTRPFIGHITLAYIESHLESADRQSLVSAVESISRAFLDREIRFFLPFCELRAYEHLAEFKHLPGIATARL
ncbi:MAG: hypothetical protein ACREIA_08165 [Opitutaceae bacterium]